MSDLMVKYAGTGLTMLFSQLSQSNDPRIEFLDPLCTAVKMAAISLKPLKTKISVRDNVVYIQEPTNFQGVERLWYRDDREQLHQLLLPLLYFKGLELGHITIPNRSINREHLSYINQLILNGLKRLRDTYENSKKTGSLIKNSLGDYIKKMSHPYTKDEYQKELNQINKPTLFVIYNEFMKKWAEQDLQMVVMMFSFVAGEKGDTYNNEIANMINHFIMAKDIEINSLRPG